MISVVMALWLGTQVYYYGAGRVLVTAHQNDAIITILRKSVGENPSNKGAVQPFRHDIKLGCRNCVNGVGDLASATFAHDAFHEELGSQVGGIFTFATRHPTFGYHYVLGSCRSVIGEAQSQHRTHIFRTRQVELRRDDQIRADSDSGIVSSLPGGDYGRTRVKSSGEGRSQGKETGANTKGGGISLPVRVARLLDSGLHRSGIAVRLGSIIAFTLLLGSMAIGGVSLWFDGRRGGYTLMALGLGLSLMPLVVMILSRR